MYVNQGRNLNGIIVFSEELFPVTLIAWLCWDVRVRWDMLRPKSSSFYIANFFQGKIGPNSASNADHSSTAILLAVDEKSTAHYCLSIKLFTIEWLQLLN
jgi:hypothetical protein